MVRTVENANEVNWTSRYALDVLKREFAGLTDYVFEQRQYIVEYRHTSWMKWEMHEVIAQARYKAEAISAAARKIFLSIIASTAGDEAQTAVEALEVCFSRHEHLKKQPEGFETAVRFLCPYCSVKGDEGQRNSVKDHIRVAHANEVVVEEPVEDWYVASVDGISGPRSRT